MQLREEERESMVSQQLVAREIVDKQVLRAMREIPRHAFVPEPLQGLAYADRPLPIGQGQTISQPYIVAFMCQCLELSGEEKVLELGTGSGYETAVLAYLAKEVYTVEIRPDLSKLGEKNLAFLQLTNVHYKIGDGLLGWPEQAPFDRIILTASPQEIPKCLLDQVSPHGKLIAPLGGEGEQSLVLFERTDHGFKRIDLLPVAFVPAKHSDMTYDTE